MQQDKLILIVDDEPELGQTLADILSLENFPTVLAADGAEALKNIASGMPFVAIISDVRMPKMDGIEFLRHVRSAHYAQPPVLLMSGFSDLSVAEAYDMGVEAFLAKPFNPDILLNQLKTTLSPAEKRWTDAGVNGQAASAAIPVVMEINEKRFSQGFSPVCLALGRGGMFLALKEKLPKVGECVEFNLPFTAVSGQRQRLQGKAVVRWVRYGEQQGKPAGIGVEFLSLSPDANRFVVDFATSQSTRAFIPQGH